MIIYNVTTLVAHTVKELWVEWMKQKHIPEVMAKGCFVKHQFVQLLELDETEGVTYAIQYYAETLDAYNKYIELYAPSLRDDSLKNWGKEVIAFRSIMQLID